MRLRAEDGVKCKVFLNGKELHYCKECDDEEGWAIVYCVQGGNFIVENDELKTTILRGEVKVENYE